jgi:hypothetical protein
MMQNNTQQLIAQLNPLHTPPAVGWWPPAPGWWILAVLVLLLLSTLIYVLIRRARANAYRAQALKQLKKLENNGATAYPALNALLKQTAISAYGRKHVASLSGSKWIQLLESHCPKVKLNSAFRQALENGLYQKTGGNSADAEAIKFCRVWIKKHQKECHHA